MTHWTRYPTGFHGAYVLASDRMPWAVVSENRDGGYFAIVKGGDEIAAGPDLDTVKRKVEKLMPQVEPSRQLELFP